MLSLRETVDAHVRATEHKSAFDRTPRRLMVSTRLAGMWIGFGDVLMWSAAGPFTVAGDPVGKLFAGSVFAAALIIVVVAGSELAASAMVILPIGAMRQTVSWMRAAGEFQDDYRLCKIFHTPSEMLLRGLMCNVLVCVAISAAGRL